jgi:hypothetical protein
MALHVLDTANFVADQWASRGDIYSLHTGNPGASGTANEATGGGYARQTTTWSPATGGVAVGSQMTFSVPDGTFTHMCRWNDEDELQDIIDTVDAEVSPAGEIKVTPSSGTGMYVAWT